MTAGQAEPTVYDDFLRDHRGAGWAVIDLGPDLLTNVSFVEPCLLVPAAYLQDATAGSTLTWEVLMTAAWEALEPMYRAGPGPALGAQTLAALGGNPQRADANPRRYVRLVLSALEAFRGRGLDRHEGRAYVELGRALTMQRWTGDALRAVEHGRKILERAGDDHGARAAYARLAALESRVGLYEQALLHAETGQRIGARLAPPATAGRGALGQVYFTDYLHHQRVRALTRIGFVADAEAALATWQGEHDDRTGAFNLLLCEAELRMRQGRTDTALDAYLRAIAARSADLAGGSRAGRGYYLENGVAAFTGAIGAALAGDRPDLAVAVLAAMATGRPRAARGGTSFPATAEPARSIDAELLQVARRATMATVARDLAAMVDQNDRAGILLETRETALHTGTDRRTDRRTVEELAAGLPGLLPAGELALYYGVTDDGRGVVFVIGAGTVEYSIMDASADDIAVLADRAHQECVRRSGTSSLERLGEILFAPIADRLAAATRVSVAAHGPLADFPFHAAPFGGRPLVTGTRVRLLPSLGSLLPTGHGGRSARPVGSGEAVVVGVRQPRYELLPDLPAVPVEKEAVRLAFPDASRLDDDRATVTAVRAALATADVLHIAGHAMFEPPVPYLARVLLADRPLFAFEVFCAGRTPPFVNLSGCRAGAEQRTIGGEGEGLAAAFLAAGSQTVVAPLWPVRDDAALAFNQVLYRELARPGTDWADAARTAQLALLAQPRFAHPGLWGAFTVLGRVDAPGIGTRPPPSAGSAQGGS